MVIVGAVGVNRYWPAGELVDRGCGGHPPGPAALVAVDGRTGESLWSRRVGHASGISHGTGVVVVGGESGVLRGFDASSGELAWCRNLPVASGIQPKFAAAGAIVATYSADGFIVAFDPSSGKEEWRVPLPGSSGGNGSPVPTALPPAPAVDPEGPAVDPEGPLGLIGGDVLWVTNGAADPLALAVIDPGNGSLIEPSPSLPAQFQPGGTVEEMGTLLLYASGTADMGRQERDLLMIDTDANTQLWRRTVPGYLTSMATTETGATLVLVIDQTAGTGTRFGETVLSAYDADDGTPAWERPLPITAAGVYAGVPGAAVVTSGTEMLAFSVETGETLWTSDQGSPGRQRPYTVDGSYRDVVQPPESGAYIGLIVAERPYRD